MTKEEAFDIWKNSVGLNEIDCIDPKMGDAILVAFDELKKSVSPENITRESILESAKKSVSPENITRESILESAKKCVCGQREQDYGTPESNFQLIANLWNAYLGFVDHDYDISATDVAMMMALMKIARIKNGGGTGDSFVDLAGYAACGGEINSCKQMDIRDLQETTDRSILEILENEKKKHVNTEVKRRSGRYPWNDDYRICRYCNNCKWKDEAAEGEHCNFCSHNNANSNESHWEAEDD